MLIILSGWIINHQIIANVYTYFNFTPEDCVTRQQFSSTGNEDRSTVNGAKNVQIITQFCCQ